MSVDQFLAEVSQIVPRASSLTGPGKSGASIDISHESDSLRYRSLFHRLSDAVLLIDAIDHRIVEANKRALEMYGYSKEELVGKSLLKLLPADQHQNMWRNTRQMLDSPRAISTIRRTHVGKSGDKIRVSVNASLIEIDGRLYFQDVIRDETKRIRLEDELSATNASLMEANQKLREEIGRRKQVEQALRDEGIYLHKLLTENELDRKMLVYEIHDSPVQNLTAAIMFHEASTASTDTTDTPLAQSHALMRRSLQELRAIMAGLRPSIIDDGDLDSVVSLAIHEHHELGGPIVSLTSQLPLYKGLLRHNEGNGISHTAGKPDERQKTQPGQRSARGDRRIER